jgi:hypothetical protein
VPLFPVEGRPVAHLEIAQLLARIAGAGFDFIKTENSAFDGEKAYSSAE